MAELIFNWLNDDVGLSRNCFSTEIFTDGYYFGEILYKFNQQLDFKKFSHKGNAVAKIENFSRLAPTFRRMGIKFNATLCKRVMEEDSELIIRILYEIKAAIEKHCKNIVGRERNGVRRFALVQIKIPKPVHEKRAQQLFEQKLKEIVRSDNDVMLEKHLQPFYETKLEMEDRARKGQEEHMMQSTMIRDAHRNQRMHTLRRFHNNQLDSEQQGFQEWEYNQHIKRARESMIQNYEMEQAQRHAMTATLLVDNSQRDMEAGIQEYEHKLELASIKARSALPSETNSDPLTEIKTRRRNQTKFAEARYRRRRQMINTLSKKIDESQFVVKETGFTKSSVEKRCNTSKEVNTELDRVHKYMDIALDNRKHREDCYTKRKELSEVEMKESDKFALSSKQNDHSRRVNIQHSRDMNFRQAALASDGQKIEEFIQNDFLSGILDSVVNVSTIEEVSEQRVNEQYYHNLDVLFPKKEVPGVLFTEDSESKEAECWEETNVENYADNTYKMRPIAESENVKNKLNEAFVDDYLKGNAKWKWSIDTRRPKTADHCEKLSETLANLVTGLGTSLASPPKNTLPSDFIASKMPPKSSSLRLCVVGGPFSGKSTVCSHLTRKFNIPSINPGHIAKYAIWKLYPASSKEPVPMTSGAELMSPGALRAIGQDALEAVVSGQSIPSQLLIEICKAAVNKTRGSFVLDGFPTNVEQALALEEAFGKLNSRYEHNKAILEPFSHLISKPSSFIITPEFANRDHDDHPTLGIQEAHKWEERGCPIGELGSIFHGVILSETDAAHSIGRALGKCVAGDKNLSYHLETNPPSNEELIAHSLNHVNDNDFSQQHTQDLFSSQTAALKELKSFWSNFPNLLCHLTEGSSVEEMVEGLTFYEKQFIYPGFLESSVAQSDSEDDESEEDEETIAQPSAISGEPSIIEGNDDESKESESKEEEGEVELTQEEKEALRKADAIAAFNEHVKENMPEEFKMCACDIPLSTAELLWEQWKIMESNLIEVLKSQATEERKQERASFAHFNNILQHFRNYLTRPDKKQDIIDEFQKNFNDLPMSIRNDDETKEELNHRVEETANLLWDNIDTRTEETTAEVDSIHTDGWLENQKISVINRHLILLQAELNAFQQIRCFLRDWFHAKSGHIVDADDLFPEVPDIVTLVGAEPAKKAKNAPPPLPHHDPELMSKALDLISEHFKTLEQVDATYKASEEKTFADDTSKAEKEQSKCPLEEIKVAEVRPAAVLSEEEEEMIRCLKVTTWRRMLRLRPACLAGCDYYNSMNDTLYKQMQDETNDRMNQEGRAVEQVISHGHSAVENALNLPIRLVINNGVEFVYDESIRLINPPEAPEFTEPMKRNDYEMSLDDLKIIIKAIMESKEYSTTLTPEKLDTTLQNTFMTLNLSENWESSLEIAQRFDALGINCVNWRLVCCAFVLLFIEEPNTKTGARTDLTALVNAFVEDNRATTEDEFCRIHTFIEKNCEDKEEAKEIKKILFSIFSNDESKTIDLVDFALSFCYHKNAGLTLCKRVKIEEEDALKLIFAAPGCHPSIPAVLEQPDFVLTPEFEKSCPSIGEYLDLLKMMHKSPVQVQEIADEADEATPAIIEMEG